MFSLWQQWSEHSNVQGLFGISQRLYKMFGEKVNSNQTGVELHEQMLYDIRL